jgi:hypothetical protein
MAGNRLGATGGLFVDGDRNPRDPLDFTGTKNKVRAVSEANGFGRDRSIATLPRGKRFISLEKSKEREETRSLEMDESLVTEWSVS